SVSTVTQHATRRGPGKPGPLFSCLAGPLSPSLPTRGHVTERLPRVWKRWWTGHFEGDDMRRSACVFALSLAALCAFAAPARAVVTSASGAFVLFGDQTFRARGLNVQKGDIGTNGTLIGTKRIDAATSNVFGNFV